MMSFLQFINEMYRKDQVKDIKSYHERQRDAYNDEADNRDKNKTEPRRKAKYHSVQHDRAHEVKRRVSKMLDNREVVNQAEKHFDDKHAGIELRRVKRDNKSFQLRAARRSKRAKSLKQDNQ